MISTRDLSALPDIETFRRLTRSLAMLDAIMSPQWQYRYYSFNSRWADREMMASMRDGSGDSWFALFAPYGVALHGLARDAPTFRPGSPPPELYDGLPSDFHTSFFDEPAFDTANSTFCIWRRVDDTHWSSGVRDLPPGDDPDGSARLLGIFEGDPHQYVEFAADYYERRIEPSDVRLVYRHEPLTAGLLRRLNPEASLDSLSGDMQEIGYPDEPETDLGSWRPVR